MGNTLTACSFKNSNKDHPHIHGEYLGAWQNLINTVGSPPHTWGIHGYNDFVQPVLRITPTYMGNTKHNKYMELLALDHPHIHGEYVDYELMLLTY